VDDPPRSSPRAGTGVGSLCQAQVLKWASVLYLTQSVAEELVRRMLAWGRE
jgi:hypothetical protein